MWSHLYASLMMGVLFWSVLSSHRCVGLRMHVDLSAIPALADLFPGFRWGEGIAMEVVSRRWSMKKPWMT